MIGIICALSAEVSGFLEALEDTSVRTICGVDYSVGKLSGRDAVIAKCGVGKVNAAVCAQTMILEFAPEIVFNSGVAGSLSPEFNIFDIAVAVDTLQHDVDSSAMGDPIGFVSTVEKVFFECDKTAVDGIVRAAAQLNLNAKPARIATGDQFIAGKNHKKWIVDTFRADACDMESCAIAQVCCISQTKFVAIRSISDSTDGKHDIEYVKFMPVAARNSVKVLIKYISELDI